MIVTCPIEKGAYNMHVYELRSYELHTIIIKLLKLCSYALLFYFIKTTVTINLQLVCCNIAVIKSFVFTK